MENRKLKVFLCHSKDDKFKVRKLYKRLHNDGFDVWLDEVKLMGGQDWAFEIEKAVKGSDIVVVCLSMDSINKEGYIQKEIKFALDEADKKPEGTSFIIPTRLEVCDVPNRINRFQWVDLFERNGYSKLKEALKLRMNDLKIRFDENEISSKNNQSMTKIPMLGIIDSSTPASLEASTMTENKKENIEIAQNLFPTSLGEKKNDLFALKVKGSSLIDALINDGDIVIMKPTESVKNGEMAAIWLSDRKEVTLKYFFKEKDGYILQPANPEFKPIKVNNNEKIEVRGKVVMVIRKKAR
ncbi:MAG TPA: hypothetical protein DIW23_04160 [Anaerolineae bacterium]|nr:hypothetical protein [Anaerolineae bacterium]